MEDKQPESDKFKGYFNQLKVRAKAIKRDVTALYLAYRSPRVPWYAKALAAVIVAYALSPIDLIPDFIPVLGYLDDLLLIPLGVSLAVKLIPIDVMQECRTKAEDMFSSGKPKNWVGAAVIVGIWLAIITFIVIKLIY